MDGTPTLIIDSGALFFKQPLITQATERTAERTAQGIAQAVKATGTQAVGIAPHDLAAGVDFLKELAQKNDLVFLSMNLYSNQDSTPVFSPFLLTQAGNIKIAILGLTGNPQNIIQSKGFQIRPWQETLPKAIQAVEKQADMIILLSSEPRKTNEQIARDFDNIHIIFQSGQGGGNQPPVNINNTLLCQTASRGKYMGFLEIKWNSSKSWAKPALNQLQKEQNHLDRINWQIGRMKKRSTKEALTTNIQFQNLLKNKAKTEQTIEQLKRKKSRQTQPPCSFKNHFIALKASLPEDTAIKAIVDQTRREVNQINRRAQQKRKKQQVGVQQIPEKKNFPVALQEMAGWQACKKCHPKQTAFYLSTDHAKAWQTLVAKDQQYNPDCLLCHVTLPTYDNKLVQEMGLLSNLPVALQGVGCETCHGPARSHIQAPDTIQPGKPDQTVCRQCHTDERDDTFIYTEKIQTIRCPAG